MVSKSTQCELFFADEKKIHDFWSAFSFTACLGAHFSSKFFCLVGRMKNNEACTH